MKSEASVPEPFDIGQTLTGCSVSLSDLATTIEESDGPFSSVAERMADSLRDIAHRVDELSSEMVELCEGVKLYYLHLEATRQSILDKRLE